MFHIACVCVLIFHHTVQDATLCTDGRYFNPKSEDKHGVVEDLINNKHT